MANNEAREEMKTYLQIISKDEKETQKENLMGYAQKAKLGLDTDILAIKESIANLKSKITVAKSSFPFKIEVVYGLTMQLEEAEAFLAFAKEAQTTYFRDITI